MSLHHMLRAAAGSAGPSDPYFEYNTLLLTGNGTNGAQNNTFLDSSTNNFTITRNGNTTQGTFSPYGNLWSNYFDGTGDYLNAGTNTAFAFGTGDYTIEMWLFQPSNGLDAQLIGCHQSGVGYAWLIQQAGSWGSTWRFLDGSAIVVASTALIPNQWNHVAVTRSGNTVRLFANGSQVGSATTSANITSTTYPLCIMSDSSGVASQSGYASNVRVVKGTALYTSNFTPSTSPLTAVSGTSLLTCQSNRFIDNSSNNFTLTVNGNTSVQRFSPFNPTAPYSAATIGGSGYFDGTGDWLSVADNIALDLDRTTNWTVEAWFCKNTTGNQAIVGSATAGGSGNWIIEVNSSNQIRGYWQNTANTVYSINDSSAISLNTWYHVALVNNNSVMSLYLNGVSVGTPQTLAGTYLNASATTSIGRTGDYAALYFNGYISNARIVKGTAVYNANFTPPTAPLTPITNTSLLCNFTNAGIPDAAMQNDLETVGNAQVSTSVKKYGTGSLAFDGSGDYLTTLGSAFALNSGDFTVEMWIYWTAIPTSDVAFVGGLNFGGASVGIYNSASNIAIISGGSTYVYFGSKNQLTTNQWNHLAITRSGNTHRCFINGVLDSAGAVTSTVNWGTPTTTYVGAQQGPVNYFNGYIDDLRITKGYARYTANFTPPTAALPTY